MAEFFLHSFNMLGHGFIGYVIPFLFVLTIVVFFHELGHFMVARWAGVKILTFSLGFGPELAGFNDRHGTRWKISASGTVPPMRTISGATPYVSLSANSAALSTGWSRAIRAGRAP